jgi:hypothetical protein
MAKETGDEANIVVVRKKETVRGKDGRKKTERQNDRETERQRDRERGRERQRETEKDRDRERGGRESI